MGLINWNWKIIIYVCIGSSTCHTHTHTCIGTKQKTNTSFTCQLKWLHDDDNGEDDAVLLLLSFLIGPNSINIHIKRLCLLVCWWSANSKDIIQHVYIFFIYCIYELVLKVRVVCILVFWDKQYLIATSIISILSSFQFSFFR